MFICPFLNHAQGFNYYWLSIVVFMVPHFLNFYFQVLVLTYFIRFLDWCVYLSVGTDISIRRQSFSLIILNQNISVPLLFIFQSVWIIKSQTIVAFLASVFCFFLLFIPRFTIQYPIVFAFFPMNILSHFIMPFSIFYCC